MRKELVFILMLFLILGVSSTSTTMKGAGTPELPNYTLSQTQMGVYSWITPEVNSSYALTMAISTIGLRGTPELVDGRYVISLGNRTFEMDTKDGSMRYADYSILNNISLGIEIPTPESCRTIAEEFLSVHDLLPAEAVFASVGTTEAHAMNPVSLEAKSKILHYQVNYEFSIGAYPIRGPRAQISVSVGEGGEVIGFDYNWREMVLHSTMPVIEYESILSMHGILPSEVVSHELHYYAGPDDEHEDLLFPTYEVVVEPEGDGLESAIPLQFHATELAPMVTIIPSYLDTTYTNEGTMQAGQGVPITLACNVTNGQAPFTYSWESDIDGPLGATQNITISNLSAAVRNDEPVAHTITLWVEDANGMVASDFVSILVTDIGPDGGPVGGVSPLIFWAGFIALCVVAFLCVMRKRRGVSVILFLVALFSAFLLVPVVSADIRTSGVRELATMAPTGAYDDTKIEVGIEWVGVTHPKPLPNTKTNIEGFYNHMGWIGGFSREFNWGEYNAWEQDFKYDAIGGDDSDWVDAVDFVYYQDHGGPNGVAFTSQMDDTGLHYSEARWGDGDLEYIVFDACSVLMWEHPDEQVNVWDRWTPAFQGLHLMLSFATGSHNVKARGTQFASYLTQHHTLIDSWFWACA
ncbi:MAG: DUF6345 domain-containing protein, partial [Candidatus Thorarchaeota archaeon]